MIKAVIFDMDGVLVAAKEWHYEALNRALALYHYEISEDKHIALYDGLPTSKKLDLLTQTEGLPKALHDEINQQKQAYTTTIIHEKCKPFPVHQETLLALKNQGYKLALASNSIRQTVDLIMEKNKLNVYLDEIISASEVTHPKPHPEIYTVAIKRLHCSPEECLVLEDNINGITAAKAAGAHVLVIKEIEDVNLDNIMSKIKQIETMEEMSETSTIE